MNLLEKLRAFKDARFIRELPLRVGSAFSRAGGTAAGGQRERELIVTAGAPLTYRYWPNIPVEDRGFALFPLGVGGVIYPPGCFGEDFFEKEIFTAICPNGDDIWLKAMSLLKGTVCHKLDVYRKKAQSGL